MAREKSDVIARGADVPLALTQTGPRDALLDPRDTDIIPDLHTKGLHVGEVAQPAEPVLHRGGDVTFESLPEAPESKFAGTLSFAEQKRLNSEYQADRPDLYGGRPVVLDEDTDEPTRQARATVREPARTSTRSSGAAEKLDDDSAKVASAQAADDKS